tara:strand:- start:194 stop:673 length:480 start_codon:yes stop_codon:yes gene_type:complete
MKLGDLGVMAMLIKNQQEAFKNKDNQAIEASRAKIREFERAYANRFTKTGKLKREFENKYLGSGFLKTPPTRKGIPDLTADEYKNLRFSVGLASDKRKLKKLQDEMTAKLEKGKKKKTTPSAGVLTGRRAKRTIRGDITKKMNMGGVMRNRGGTFKGVF